MACFFGALVSLISRRSTDSSASTSNSLFRFSDRSLRVGVAKDRKGRVRRAICVVRARVVRARGARACQVTRARAYSPLQHDFLLLDHLSVAGSVRRGSQPESSHTVAARVF